MWYARSDRNRPIYQPQTTRVSLGGDESVMVGADGVINLALEARKLFAVLDTNNVFTGTDNAFEHIQARQMHFVSDPRQKENTTVIPPQQAVDLVQSITPYTYDLTNATASAGLMADDVPPEYMRTTGDGMQTVDYNAMFTHLWAAVQHLIAEQGELRAMFRNGQPQVAQQVVVVPPPCPPMRRRRHSL